MIAKFRGFTIDTKQEVYGYHVKTDEDSWIIGLGLTNEDISVGFSLEETNPASCDCYKVSPASVGQFTGKKDKNGVEIYGGLDNKGGDIVKRYAEDAPENCKKHNGAIGVVKYTHYSLGEFSIDLIKGGKWSFYYPDGDNFSTEDLEVIGNAYENPELLKGEQE